MPPSSQRLPHSLLLVSASIRTRASCGVVGLIGAGSTGAGAAGADGAEVGVSVMLLLLLKRCYFGDDGLIRGFAGRGHVFCQSGLFLQQRRETFLLIGADRARRLRNIRS